MNYNYSVIDSDAHVLEPGDLWLNYMATKYRDRAPGVMTTSDGVEVFRIEQDNVIDLRGNTQAAFAAIGGIGMRDGRLPKGTSYYDGKPGGFDPKLRLPDMDAEGIDAAFLYPSLGLYLGAIKDQELAPAACRAYNRWLADYCKAAPERLYGVAIIPLQSTEAAVSEIEYARSTLGFRAGFVRPNPYNDRPLHHRDNDPVWQAAQDHDLGIAVHASAANLGMPMLGYDRFKSSYVVNHCAAHTLEMIAAVTSFILAGVCDRFPKLKVGFMEAGGGWIAGYLDRMDRHFDDMSMNNTGLKTRPSDIFRRQCFISFEPIERTLPLLADYIGRDRILWASDYPHSDGYVDAPAMIRKLGLPEPALRDVMSTGAKGFYGLS